MLPRDWLVVEREIVRPSPLAAVEQASALPRDWLVAVQETALPRSQVAALEIALPRSQVAVAVPRHYRPCYPFQVDSRHQAHRTVVLVVLAVLAAVANRLPCRFY